MQRGVITPIGQVMTVLRELPQQDVEGAMQLFGALHATAQQELRSRGYYDSQNQDLSRALTESAKVRS